MSINEKKIIVIIPARGGSKGIPRKNIRLLAGKPLISYTIESCRASKYIDRVIVSTDDDEISYVASKYGADVLRRPETLALDHIPLDPVIYYAIIELENTEKEFYDIVITVQPTCPLLSSDTIDEAIKTFIKRDVDTLLSVMDDRHLSWTKIKDKYVPNYTERKNRQYLTPNFRETGGIVITKRRFLTDTTRFGEKVEVFELTKAEAIDIDNEMDWWVAEKILKRRKILIRVDGYKEIGLGHIYRTLLLANRLIDHELIFVLEAKSDIGIQLIKANNYRVESFTTLRKFDDIIGNYKPDIIINDILDTSSEYIEYLKSKNLFIVNFEDMGQGAQNANLVINALYNEKYPSSNHYWGKDYYCLREEFFLLKSKPINIEVKNILITFGGTDANDYTRRVLEIISKLNLADVNIVVITGLGYENMDVLREESKNLGINIELLQDIRYISKYMYEADIAITSAGRTVYELASIGTPTIVLAQNNRELRHTFACADNGIINLGLGYEVANDEIIEAILRLINDYGLRLKCSQLMLNNDLKSGVTRVINLIFNEYDKILEE